MSLWYKNLTGKPLMKELQKGAIEFPVKIESQNQAQNHQQIQRMT